VVAVPDNKDVGVEVVAVPLLQTCSPGLVSLAGMAAAPPASEAVADAELASTETVAIPTTLPGQGNVTAMVMSSSAVETSRSVATHGTFFNKLAVKTSSVLPTPSFPKFKKKIRTPAVPPRRSRCLSGVGVEFSIEQEQSRYKKRVMRSLDVLRDQDGIDEAALDEYAKLFSQPLSDTHSLALACLFGWHTPEELIEGSSEALVVQ